MTPANEGTDGAIRLANQIVSDDPEKYFMPNQFENINNVQAHYETTGPEIWTDTHEKVTHFIAGIATIGTIMGACRFIKERNPSIKIVGVEPTKGHKIQGLKNMEESIIPKIYDQAVLDEIISVCDEEVEDIATDII